MTELLQNKLAISKEIDEFLTNCVSSSQILAFHMENQLGLNAIAIYILGEKAKMLEFSKFLRDFLTDNSKYFSIDLSILYNYILDEKMYDLEFIQGEEEIRRGYSIDSFGYLADISDTMDADYYYELARRRPSQS